MKYNFLKIFLLILSLLFALTGCFNNNNKNSENNQENNTATKLSATVENTENISNNTDNNTEQNSLNTENIINEPIKTEEELNSYTSPVLDKSADRVNNLQIACNTLNNHIVNPGETFSFETLIGETTQEKGYKKAKVLDSKGKVYKDYGGGICQVSSTLFNAVEPCNVEIIERHHHSKRVYYVPEGKDAAISHSGCDFKFKNNNEYPLKIYASADKNNVTIRIVKLNQS